MKTKINLNNLSVLIITLLILQFFSSCSNRENRKPNMLLITIDTLRQDHVGIYGYPRNTTPFIDQLAREGVVFKHALTPQPQTSPSHASILTSLHPLTHGLVFNAMPLPEQSQSIAEVLKTNGYYTMATVSVKILSDKYKFSQGFDSFSDQWEIDPKYPFLRKNQRTAEAVNKSLFQQIRDYRHHHKNKPFFIWVHYYDPHEPYIGREHITFKNKLPPHDKKYSDMLEKYDREIRYTDNSIKSLFQFLHSEGLTKNLVTCITSDHGEQFGEHGYRHGHNDFYSETTFVPLIFHGAGITKKRIIDQYVSTMDIAVTLLNRANLSFDYPTEGLELLKLSGGNSLNQTVDRKFLLIASQKYGASPQLLDSLFSFILNYDFHYVHWYLSTHPPAHLSPIKENQFKPFHDTHVSKTKTRISIKLPPTTKPGLFFAIIRGDIGTGNFDKRTQQVAKHVEVQLETYPSFLSKKRLLSLHHSRSTKQQIQTFEVIYPMTMVNRLKILMQLKPEKTTAIQNLRYAIIKRGELFHYLSGLNESKKSFQKQNVNWLWATSLTKRKNSKKDELFDLANDFKMQKNLADNPQLKPVIMKYKKLLHQVYRYYQKRNKQLLRGTMPNHQRSAADEALLKSLGYL